MLSLPSRRPPFRTTAEFSYQRVRRAGVISASDQSIFAFSHHCEAAMQRWISTRCFSLFSLYARDIACNSELLQNWNLSFSFCFASCIYLCCHLYFLTFLCFECVHLKRWFGSRNLFSTILGSHLIFLGFTARFCPRNCTNFVSALHDAVQLRLHLCEENWFLCLSVISVVALGIVSAGPQVLMQVSRKGINLTLYLFPISVTEQIRNVTVDGGFGAWSGWSSCSHNDGGIAGSCLCRTRACDHPAPQCGGQQCIGISVEVANCSR